jgi:hypothetical protein
LLQERGRHGELRRWRRRTLARMHDLSAYLREVKQRFSQWYNKGTGRSGPLWEDRFRSVLLDGTAGLTAMVAAYIDLNPLRARLCSDPAHYRYCGYGEAVRGSRRAQRSIRRMLDGTAAPSRRGALRAYRDLLGLGQRESARPQGAAGSSPGPVSTWADRGEWWGRATLLRHRLPALTKCLALGSKSFVAILFPRRAKRQLRVLRTDGARPLRDCGSIPLFGLRGHRRDRVDGGG